MKINLNSLSVMTLAVFCLAIPLRADFIPKLDAAPYVVDQFTLGVDGWRTRLASATPKPDSVRAVALRWNDYKPALKFRDASLTNIFAPTTSEKVNISFQLALTFPDHGKLREFRMWFGGAPIGEIYFDHGSGLGHHGTGDRKEGTTILEKASVKTNSFYTYNIALDFKKETYDLSVTGQKKDGSPLNYQAQGVAFQKNYKTKGVVDSMLILCGERLPVYLSSIKIESR